ncbi:MAG TPA: hypothetical protein VJ836_03100 [Candidatus Saccharimonadales bacterium]|nr:hypothetical protein [Candidatus Saccharimonadales bacterium]
MPGRQGGRSIEELPQEKVHFPAFARAIREGKLGELLLVHDTAREWDAPDRSADPVDTTYDQRSTLILMGQGKKIKEIAKIQIRGVRAVEHDRDKLLAKFSVYGSAHAVREAIRRRMLVPQELAVTPRVCNMHQRRFVLFGFSSHGASYPEIAGMTGIGLGAVANAVKQAQEAFEARNMAEAVYKAAGMGILQPDMLLHKELLIGGIARIMQQPMPCAEIR